MAVILFFNRTVDEEALQVEHANKLGLGDAESLNLLHVLQKYFRCKLMTLLGGNWTADVC